MASLIRQFGAFGVFLLMIPEAACIPIPSEATLLLAGVAVRQGWMSFPLAVGAAIAGNLVGSSLAYALGASHILDGVPVTRSVIARWSGFIEHYGSRATLYARLLPLARTFVSLPAGASRIPFGPFTALTIVGSAIWALAFVGLGVAVAGAWGAVNSWPGRALLLLGVVALAVAIHRGGRGDTEKGDVGSDQGERAHTRSGWWPHSRHS